MCTHVSGSPDGGGGGDKQIGWKCNVQLAKDVFIDK